MLSCPALAPLLGFVPSADLVVRTWHLTGLHKLWMSLSCRAAVFSFIFVRTQRPLWRNVPSHIPSHSQHFALQAGGAGLMSAKMICLL